MFKTESEMSEKEKEESVKYRGKYTRTFLGGGTGAIIGGVLGVL